VGEKRRTLSWLKHIENVSILGRMKPVATILAQADAGTGESLHDTLERGNAARSEISKRALELA
jgi:hypothetical protein